MNICPITYEATKERYSTKGLRKLARSLKQLRELPFTAEEQLFEASARSDKISIQGVQPKLSARLDVKASSFILVDEAAHYILKPPNPHYPELPENEDLTMRLAALAGIKVPLHGLIYAKDQTLTYFIRRFDRIGKSKKLAVEDFAQLSGRDRESKYYASMEQVIKIVEAFATFPAIEKVKLFRLTIFNYLIGNEDMHLKNFSMITREMKVELSPGYDLINTTIAIRRASEEIALPLKGKKRNLTKNDLIRYFALDRLKLPVKVRDKELMQIKQAAKNFGSIVAKSFLSSPMQARYLDLLNQRCSVLFE